MSALSKSCQMLYLACFPIQSANGIPSVRIKCSTRPQCDVALSLCCRSASYDGSDRRICCCAFECNKPNAHNIPGVRMTRCSSARRCHSFRSASHVSSVRYFRRSTQIIIVLSASMKGMFASLSASGAITRWQFKRECWLVHPDHHGAVCLDQGDIPASFSTPLYQQQNPRARRIASQVHSDHHGAVRLDKWSVGLLECPCSNVV